MGSSHWCLICQMYFFGAVSTTFRAPYSPIILEKRQKSPKLGNSHQNCRHWQIALQVRGKIYISDFGVPLNQPPPCQSQWLTSVHKTQPFGLIGYIYRCFYISFLLFFFYFISISIATISLECTVLFQTLFMKWQHSRKHTTSSHVHIALLNKLCLWSPMQGTCVFMRSEACAANNVPLCSWRIVRIWLGGLSLLFRAIRSPENSFEV